VYLNSTDFPLPFIEAGEVSLAPPMTAENFAMNGYEDIPDLGGRYKSGDDIQSYAGAAWLPFISEIRKKEEALFNYTGYYIGNSFMADASLKFEEADLQNMRKVSLLSIYFTSKKMCELWRSTLGLTLRLLSHLGPAASLRTGCSEVSKSRAILLPVLL
jgi:hypothetical protein